jgi:DNA topoisomerase IA
VKNKKTDDAVVVKQMMLREDTNYIVSGLERSGTSMMMQLLVSGGIPVAYTETRKADTHNPKGYYELEGGKIINTLMKGTFPMETYKGNFIKITAYGLSYLPTGGKYKIIYMERNLDEVLDSMEKMSQVIDENREETKQSFKKLNEKVKKEIQTKENINVLFINYNEMLIDPHANVRKICEFIGPYHFETEKMISIVDKQLYRQRR